MACLNAEDRLDATISGTEETDGVTLYCIHVTLGDVNWSVKQRYSSFLELHDKLVTNHGIARDLIPPKKILGSRDPVFVEKRRVDLHLYIQTIINFMPHVIPSELAEFLNLGQYEITHLLQNLAKRLYAEADKPLLNLPVKFSPLELHSIFYRMKYTVPSSCVVPNFDSDFTHIADFVSQVGNVCVEGSDGPFLSSNIIQNDLRFTLLIFKQLESLTIQNCNLSKIDSLGPVRKWTRTLCVVNCGMKGTSDILLCDSVYREMTQVMDAQKWTALVNLDLSGNQIDQLDLSLALACNVERLDISDNKLTRLDYLTKLPHLLYLNLSHNKLSELDDLHLKLGHVVHLNLSQNNLASLKGLGKLYSLVSLDVSMNDVWDVSEVSHVSALPCLESLALTGNPVASIVDYRIKVLERFCPRAADLCLDNERPTQRELDTAAVLRAIRVSREGRLPELSLSSAVVPSAEANFTLPAPDKATAVSESMSEL